MKRTIAATVLAAASGLAVLVATPASADATIMATCSRTVLVNGDSYGENGVPIPSAGSTASSTACGMAQGAHSSAVAQLQRSLNTCYGERLVVDSDFGPATKAALARAQRREGIKADGIYGTQTRNNLEFTMGLSTCDGVTLPIRVV